MSAAELAEQPGPTVDRLTYIGGTDIAAIAGVHPYKSALDVWAEKTGRKGAAVDEGKEAVMRAGKVLERPIVEQLYAQPRGLSLRYPGTARSRELPWAGVTPDAVARVDGADSHGVECKLVGRYQWHRWGADYEGADGIPAEVLCQVQWAMWILGIHWWDVVALLGTELRVYRVTHDDDLARDLCNLGGRFWRDHVQADQMPEPTGMASERAVLEAHYPRVRAGMMEADTGEVAALALEYDHAKKRVDDAKAEQDRIANKLIAAIGEHRGAEGDWGRVLWSERKGSVDWKRAAQDMGITQDDAEKYRRPPSRALRVTVKREET